jgi:hypothetical protein
MRLSDLLKADRLQFGSVSDTLVNSYSAVAELACCLAVGVAMPRNVICTFAETCAHINGSEICGLENKRPSLLETCDLFGIPHMSKDQKDAMRDLILSKRLSEYTTGDRAAIEDYNADHVNTDIKVFEKRAEAIDLPIALHRGEYSKAGIDGTRRLIGRRALHPRPHRCLARFAHAFHSRTGSPALVR